MAGLQADAVKIAIVNRLPMIRVDVEFQGRTIELDHVLLDTGSASTIFAMDALRALGLSWSLDDQLRSLSGIGGYESIVDKVVDRVSIGAMSVSPMQIEMGGMDYGFELDGIIGLDFLLAVKAIIDFDRLELRPA